MRTTLVIDGAVFSAAKRLALESGVTPSTLTTQALREALQRGDAKPAAGRFVKLSAMVRTFRKSDSGSTRVHPL